MFAATAIVSGTGGISTVSISNGGSGYTASPHVSIGITAGIGTVHAGIGTRQQMRLLLQLYLVLEQYLQLQLLMLVLDIQIQIHQWLWLKLRV